MSETSKPEIVPVEDLDAFVQILTRWHANKVRLLEHMMEIPDGTELSVNDGPSVKLAGDLRDGFMVGLTVALGELGQLPFVTEQHPVAEEPDAAQPA